MNEDDVRKIAREELEDAAEKAYTKGYFDGWEDAYKKMGTIFEKIKKSGLIAIKSARDANSWEGHEKDNCTFFGKVYTDKELYGDEED